MVKNMKDHAVYPVGQGPPDKAVNLILQPCSIFQQRTVNKTSILEKVALWENPYLELNITCQCREFPRELCYNTINP